MDNGQYDKSVFSRRELLRRVSNTTTASAATNDRNNASDDSDSAAIKRVEVRPASTYRIREHSALSSAIASANIGTDTRPRLKGGGRERATLTGRRHGQIPQRQEQMRERLRGEGYVNDDDDRMTEQVMMKTSATSTTSAETNATNAATFAGSALQIRDDYYVIGGGWNDNNSNGIDSNDTSDNRRKENEKTKTKKTKNTDDNYGDDDEEFTFRSQSVGENIRSELEHAKQSAALVTREIVRKDVDDTIDDTVANLLEMIENERKKSQAYEKSLEKTERAYLDTKKESEEIAERLTGAASIISELKGALVHAMREQHDDEKFEDDVNQRFERSSDTNSAEAVGARRWEAKLRRTVSSALERFTHEARGIPNGEALYRAAKDALDPVVSSAIAGVVEEVEIVKRKNEKNFSSGRVGGGDDADSSYSLDDDDLDDLDDLDDEERKSAREAEENDLNALDGRAKLVAWMRMEKAKRKRLTRSLLKTKDELAKSEASRMAATRRWLETASQLESERGSHFTQSQAGDGMGSSSSDDDDEYDEDDTPKSSESRRTDPAGTQSSSRRKAKSLDGNDARYFITKTPTSPSSDKKGIRRRKSKSASASLVDPTSPSKNYGTFSPFENNDNNNNDKKVINSATKSNLSRRSSTGGKKKSIRFEDRILEGDEDEEDEDDYDEKRSALHSLDVSFEIQKTIRNVTGNPTFRDITRTIASTLERLAQSPTFELVWPIVLVIALVFWRTRVISFHRVEQHTLRLRQHQQRLLQQQQQQQQQREQQRHAQARVLKPPPPLQRYTNQKPRASEDSDVLFAYVDVETEQTPFPEAPDAAAASLKSENLT